MSDPSPEFLHRAGVMISLGLSMKHFMLDEGLTTHQETCPLCKMLVSAELVGRKGHLRLVCETPDCIRMME